MAVWADNLSNILPASITSLKLNIYGDTAYYLVPAMTDASAKLLSYVQVDSRGRPQIAHAHTLQIQFTTLMASGANLFKKLYGYQRAHVKAVLDSGHTLTTALLDTVDTASLDTAMGIEWEYTNETSADRSQTVKFTLEMAITNAEALLLVGSPAGVADGSPDADDIGYGLSQYAATDIKPCGIKKVELASTGGSYTDAFTTIEDTKFTAKSISDNKENEHRKRATPHGVEVQVEAKLMQAGTGEIANALAINQRVNDLKITLVSTTVVTFGSTVGCKFDPIVAEGNIDKRAYMPLTASGKMTLSSWTGIWP